MVTGDSKEEMLIFRDKHTDRHFIIIYIYIYIYIYYHNFIIQVLSELHTITKLQIGISSTLLSINFKRYVHEKLG